VFQRRAGVRKGEEGPLHVREQARTERHRYLPNDIAMSRRHRYLPDLMIWFFVVCFVWLSFRRFMGRFACAGVHELKDIAVLPIKSGR
jgi:hypothetical protein